MKAEELLKEVLSVEGVRAFKKEGNYVVVSSFGFGFGFSEDEEVEDENVNKARELLEMSKRVVGLGGAIPESILQTLGEEVTLEDLEGNDKLGELISDAYKNLDSLGESGEVTLVVSITDDNCRQIRESLSQLGDDVNSEITTLSSEYISVTLSKQEEEVEEEVEEEYTPEELWARQVAKKLTGSEDGFEFDSNLNAYFAKDNDMDDFGGYGVNEEDEEDEEVCGVNCGCKKDDESLLHYVEGMQNNQEDLDNDCDCGCECGYEGEDECTCYCYCEEDGEENTNKNEVILDTPFGQVIIRQIKD